MSVEKRWLALAIFSMLALLYFMSQVDFVGAR